MPTEAKHVAPAEAKLVAPTEARTAEPPTELPVRGVVTDGRAGRVERARVEPPGEAAGMSESMKALFANQALREQREAWEAQKEAARKAGGSGTTSAEPFSEPYPGYDPSAKKLWHAFGDPEIDSG